MTPIIEVEQGSADWVKMRVAMVTGSRVADVMAKLKKKEGEAAVRANYRMELIVENLTGLAVDHYVSPAMEHGIEFEPLARAAYEMATGNEVDPGGFAIHPRIERFGSSPDGRIGTDGLLEIKCPTSDTHLGYLLAGTVPEEYQPQMMAEMACTGRKWVDFVSFDPRMPQHLQLFIRRFEWNDARIGEMEREVEKFLGEVNEMLAKIELASAAHV